MRVKPTGGIRLQRLLEMGIPYTGGVWIDTYNQIFNQSVSGTIKARIDGNCMYFVTVICERQY